MLKYNTCISTAHCFSSQPSDLWQQRPRNSLLVRIEWFVWARWDWTTRTSQSCRLNYMQAASCTDPLVFVPSHHCHQQPLLHPPTWCSFWSALFLSLNLRSAERPVRLCLWRSCKRLRKTRYWGRGNFGSVVIVLQPLRSLSASRLAPANGRHKTVGRFGESFADARHRRSDCSLAGWLAGRLTQSLDPRGLRKNENIMKEDTDVELCKYSHRELAMDKLKWPFSSRRNCLKLQCRAGK